MQKMWKCIEQVSIRIFYIGMTLQIGLGIWWLFENIGILAQYGDGTLYEQAVANWDFTDCKGILYPFVVSISKGMASIMPIPYYCILYVFQLLAAFLSVFVLLRYISGRHGGRLFYAVAGVLTTPPVLQTILAVQPNILAASCGITALVWGLEYSRSFKWTSLLGSSVFGLAAILFRGEFFWFGLVAAVILCGIGMLRRSRKQKRYTEDCRKKTERSRKQCLRNGLLAFVIMLVLSGGYFLQKSALQDNRAFSVKQTVVARLTWDSLSEIMWRWSPDLGETIGWENAAVMNAKPELIRELLFANFADLTAEKENAYLKEMVQIAWEHDKREIVVQIIYDGLGYLFPAIIAEKQLNGTGYLSLTGINYQAFKEGDSRLGAVFMRYYFWWFWIALAVMLIGMLCRKMKPLQESGPDEKKRGMLWCGIGIVIANAFYYTFTEPGMYDYKLAIVAVLFWSTGICLSVMSMEEKQV